MGSNHSTHHISNWEKASVIATIIQAAVVIGTVLLINSQVTLQTDQLRIQTDQLQQQTDLARASNVQALAALAMPLNLEEVKDAETARVWFRGVRGFDKPTRVDNQELAKSRYQSLLATWLIFYENMFYQHSRGLLPDDVFQPWDKDLQDFVQQSRLYNYWDEMKDSYHDKFRQHIEQILKDQRPSR